MAGQNVNYDAIAREAERDLNTYQAKTGRARAAGLERDDGAGVSTMAEKKFPGADVTYGDELTDQRRGGDLPLPEEPSPEDMRRRGRREDLLPSESAKGQALGSTDPFTGRDDILRAGRDAAKANVGVQGEDLPAQGQGAAGKFRGDDYYQPEDVPDSIAAQGEIPPESTVQASRETEGYGTEGRR